MKTALDLIDDPLHDLRRVAVRYDLPMPSMDMTEDAEGTRRYVDKQWPQSSAYHWFFPNEVPNIETHDRNGTSLLRRESYEGPTDALRSVLTVKGGTGSFVIEELVAEFLVTRLIHDPLAHADYKAWAASGKPRRGNAWRATMDTNSWNSVLAAKPNWNDWFAELVAHLAAETGLVKVGTSIYSSRLTDRAKAWALLIQVQDLRHNGKAHQDEYAALLAMGADA